MEYTTEDSSANEEEEEDEEQQWCVFVVSHFITFSSSSTLPYFCCYCSFLFPSNPLSNDTVLLRFQWSRLLLSVTTWSSSSSARLWGAACPERDSVHQGKQESVLAIGGLVRVSGSRHPLSFPRGEGDGAPFWRWSSRWKGRRRGWRACQGAWWGVRSSCSCWAATTAGHSSCAPWGVSRPPCVGHLVEGPPGNRGGHRRGGRGTLSCSRCKSWTLLIKVPHTRIRAVIIESQWILR